MTLRNTLVPALLFLAACADDTPTNAPDSIESGKEKAVQVQSEDRGVPFYGLTQDLNRSSDLAQINTANIKNLTPVWTLALGEKIGLQTQPLVIGNVMYATTPQFDALQSTRRPGRQIWKTGNRICRQCVELLWLRQPRPGLPRRQTVPDEYRQPHNRSLTRTTARYSGKKKYPGVSPSYSMTSAPLVANGVLITGIGGSEFAAPGFIDGWDPDTGEHLWRLHTIPRPGEPGSETWEGG